MPIAEWVQVSNDWPSIGNWLLKYSFCFVWCLYCERSTRNQLYIDDRQLQKMVFTLSFLEDAFLVWTGKWIIILKAVLGCLMVLIPWIASAITSVAWATYDTLKILLFLPKISIIYIYFFRYHSISNLWSLYYSDCSLIMRQNY